MKILLDTNFLIYCAKQKIDYAQTNAQLHTITSVVEELQKLQKKAKKLEEKEAANLALQLLKTNKVKIHKSTGNADQAIIKKSENYTIATMDKELKKRLKGKTRILTIRTKKNLELL